jgi:hypothetical protein
VLGTYALSERCAYTTDRPSLASQEEIRTQKDRSPLAVLLHCRPDLATSAGSRSQTSLFDLEGSRGPVITDPNLLAARVNH